MGIVGAKNYIAMCAIESISGSRAEHRYGGKGGSGGWKRCVIHFASLDIANWATAYLEISTISEPNESYCLTCHYSALAPLQRKYYNSGTNQIEDTKVQVTYRQLKNSQNKIKFEE